MRAWGRVGDGLVVHPHSASGCVFRTPAADARLLPAAVYSDSRLSYKTSINICWPRTNVQFESYRIRCFKVKALQNDGENQTPIAPLKLESTAGQLLSQILQTHPHLFPETIDQQLEQLEADKEAQNKKELLTSEDSLYRRIAEVKEKERHKTLEEIMYCLVVKKFMETGISMIPIILPSLDPMMQVDSWPNQEKKLQAVHSPDAFEMIDNHISLILGERSVGPLNTVAQISKIKLGKLYAASIMYGYFLKRVDERFQLERRMKTVPTQTDDRERVLENLKANPLWDVESMVQIPSDEDGDFGDGDMVHDEGKSKSPRLRSYVMYLDADTLQRYATIRSKEATSLVEKQTQALFGRPDIIIADDGSIEVSNDEIISITFSGLTMLVLEAVAFGSFLWDSEGYIESKYHFVTI